MKTAKVTRTLKSHKVYGKFSKMEFENGSRIYVSKKGWNIYLPPRFRYLWRIVKRLGRIEINLDYDEIQMALGETARAGYIDEYGEPK